MVGFSWLEVMTGDGTVIKDGEHDLIVYKTDSMEKVFSGTYLNNEQNLPKSGKESVVIRTHLCSTKLTQNVDLMSFLNWRESPSDIPNILACLMKTGTVSIMFQDLSFLSLYKYYLIVIECL